MGDYWEELIRKQGRVMASYKMALCLCQDLTLKTQLEAVNGKKMPALEVFAHALRFFKEHALQVCCSSQPTAWGRDTLAPAPFLSPHPTLCPDELSLPGHSPVPCQVS